MGAWIQVGWRLDTIAVEVEVAPQPRRERMAAFVQPRVFGPRKGPPQLSVLEASTGSCVLCDCALARAHVRVCANVRAHACAYACARVTSQKPPSHA